MLCKTLMKMMRAGVAAAAILFFAAPPVSGQTTTPCNFQFVTFKEEVGTSALAYGFINRDDGMRVSGTTNFDSRWDEADRRYEITIDGENYISNNFTTVVTPAGDCAGVAVSTNSESGYLIVEFWDVSP